MLERQCNRLNTGIERVLEVLGWGNPVVEKSLEILKSKWPLYFKSRYL